jgi:uncharacterized protein (DUF488 family)
MGNQLSLWTVGHSTLSIEEFIDRLKSFDIQVLADVRSFPGSRRYPHFNQESLSSTLPEVQIRYEHLRELGGRRRVRPDSLNVVWHNESFRGYADYMETADFRSGIERLLAIAGKHRVAIMCSEAVWWRCHRSLISDYLKVGGTDVRHIMGNGKSEPHPLTSAARIVNGELSYRGVLSE